MAGHSISKTLNTTLASATPNIYRNADMSKGYKLVSKNYNLSDTANGQYKGQYSLLWYKAPE